MAKQSAIRMLDQDFRKHVKDEEMDFQRIHSRLDEIHTDVQSIKNIQVNGEVGLEVGLRQLYGDLKEMKDLTKDLKAEREFKKARTKYFETRPVRAFFMTTWRGRIVGSVVVLYGGLSILSSWGVPVNPNEIILGLVKIIFKIV